MGLCTFYNRISNNYLLIPVKVFERRFRSLHHDHDDIERVSATLTVSAGDLTQDVVNRVFQYCNDIVYAKYPPMR